MTVFLLFPIELIQCNMFGYPTEGISDVQLSHTLFTRSERQISIGISSIG